MLDDRATTSLRFSSPNLVVAASRHAWNRLPRTDLSHLADGNQVCSRHSRLFHRILLGTSSATSDFRSDGQVHERTFQSLRVSSSCILRQRLSFQGISDRVPESLGSSSHLCFTIFPFGGRTGRAICTTHKGWFAEGASSGSASRPRLGFECETDHEHP